jgi:FKBP-type peptidyl-prolyl cis-trans isomerase FkpA
MRLVLAAVLIALTTSACSGGADTPTSPTESVPYSTTNLRVGTGAEAVTGRTVAVEYTGWLYSASAPDNKGTQFDSSFDPGRDPFVLVAGGTTAIPGFSQAVVGMRVGGLRRVVIPPSLGYGSQANGPIPANSTLVFEIELLAIQP